MGVVNPATGVQFATFRAADADTVASALDSCDRARTEWTKLSFFERGQILNKAARILRERNDLIAEVETLDTGKPVSETFYADIVSAADVLEYYGGVAGTLHGQFYQFGESLGGAIGYTVREPLGVVAGIGPWNYPCMTAAWKAAPALACGNTMVYKPSEATPLTILMLADALVDAGVPPGVFNVLQGDGPVGRMLTESDGVDKVTFTGSVPSGKAVMATAAQTLKKVTLELGGKSPLLVFEDADLENAVTGAMAANFYSQGEVCSNATRVFVHESMVDAFTERLAERAAKMVIGDPTDPATHVGAVIHEKHMDLVLGYIEKGKTEGAECVSGGSRRDVGGRCADGFFVEPTVFAGCSDDMTIVKEEIFGPVVSVLSFRDEEEAIARANNTKLGLSAGVFTNNLQRAHRVVSKLEAGSCWVNNYNLCPPELPFGGNKQSGIGRENGLGTVELFSQLKSVYVDMSDEVACDFPK